MAAFTDLSVLSVVFLLLLIYHSFALRHPLCHHNDRSFLLQFKHSFVFDEFSSSNCTKLSSWNVGVDCCLWDGIDCDNETGHVIGLDLSSSCLFGSINSSSSLFRLVHLKSLDLSYNNFNLSTIPSAIKSLSWLEHLNLTSSSFTSQIPSEMLQLPKLVSLDLSWNSLTLQKPSLKDVVEMFRHLDILHLSGVYISSAVPQSLTNLTSLSSLRLGKCSLLGEFPSSVFRLPNLRVLGLRYNPNLTGYLPEFGSISSPLEELLLDGTNLSGRLPASIGSLKSLRVLSAADCGLGGVIPSSVGNLSNLDTLRLPNNHFSWKIPSSVGNLTQLTRLILYQNQLTGSIPGSIFRLPNLQALSMQSNRLSGSLNYGSFLQMKHISILQLSDNHLSVVSSPYMNGTLPRFRTLGLARCNLRGFPTFLREQKELEFLRLSDNSIEAYAPNWLFSLKSLNILILDNNSLLGFEQPLEILSLPNLHILNLESNQLKGPLPFPSLSIIFYSVSKNKFSGHISPLFCNLTAVVWFDLSSNQLSGTLPPCLRNFASVLNLRNNGFSGEIPEIFTSDCKLKVMDFGQNRFEGKVPNTFAKCSRLEVLNLDENRMNDVFPSWLGALPHLTVLSLRSNQFHGTIGKPLTRLDFGRLHIIDLSDNNFRGKLPLEFFGNWLSMKSVDQDRLAYMHTDTSFRMPGSKLVFRYQSSITIMIKGTKRAYDRILEFFVVADLSSNKFEGEIPGIIGTLRALQSLNLSNNMLTGHIPSSLGNLTMLEALDLSRNELSGQIPTQLSLNTFLAVFNVSHNGLTGPIPRGNQFGTFDKSSFSDNPGLCGDVLPKKCGKTESLQLPPSKGGEEDDESPFQFNWEIVLIGFGTGLVIGVAFGWALDTGKYEWLVKKKFARRVRRRRRN